MSQSNKSQLLWILGAVAGFATIGITNAQYPLGEGALVPNLIACFAFAIALTCVMVPIRTWIREGKARRLMAGEDLMTGWRVPPADWQRFREIDEAWARGGGQRIFKPTGNPPASGVAVHAGYKAIVVDGHWFALKNLMRKYPDDIAWLPTMPECIEFCLVEGSDSQVMQTFRVPVPAAARAEGRRVFEYWEAMMRTEGRDRFRRVWRYDPERIAVTAGAPTQ